MNKILLLLSCFCLISTGCYQEIEEGSVCGNNIIEGKEECDGEFNCNDLCYFDHYVFVSDNKYKGNFGGIGMVDHACYEESKKTGNTDPTRFRAIIGTNESSPIDRFNFHKGRIVTLRGDVVAEEGLFDLFDASLLSAINESPTQTDITDRVFTGIDEFGESIKDRNCENWTSNEGYPTTGCSNYLNADAFDCTGYTPSCFEDLRIYCYDDKGGPLK